MDFQIVTMVYATIDADDQHYIISKDRGFDVAIKMGARCNCTNVERFPDIKTAYNDYQLKNPKEVAPTEDNETVAEAESEPTGTNIVELVAASISRTFTDTDEVMASINETKKADGDKKKIKSFIQKKMWGNSLRRKPGYCIRWFDIMHDQDAALQFLPQTAWKHRWKQIV